MIHKIEIRPSTKCSVLYQCFDAKLVPSWDILFVDDVKVTMISALRNWIASLEIKPTEITLDPVEGKGWRSLRFQRWPISIHEYTGSGSAYYCCSEGPRMCVKQTNKILGLNEDTTEFVLYYR